MWVSIDGTTDIEGRYVVRRPGKNVLFNAKNLQKTNNSTIAKLCDKSMCLLWLEGIKHNNILLFLSDVDPYMVKARENI